MSARVSRGSVAPMRAAARRTRSGIRRRVGEAGAELGHHVGAAELSGNTVGASADEWGGIGAATGKTGPGRRRRRQWQQRRWREARAGRLSTVRQCFDSGQLSRPAKRRYRFPDNNSVNGSLRAGTHGCGRRDTSGQVTMSARFDHQNPGGEDRTAVRACHCLSGFGRSRLAGDSERIDMSFDALIETDKITQEKVGCVQGVITNEP